MKKVTVVVDSDYPYRFDQPIALYDQDGFLIGVVDRVLEVVD